MTLPALNVAALPDLLDYEGEFGAELVLFLPFCRWLSEAGLLKRRKISTYGGMRCFYQTLRCEEIVEKYVQRCYVPPKRRPQWLPIRDEHTFDGLGNSAFHAFANLRSQFDGVNVKSVIGSGRPTLVIHNKHNDEWDRGPVNHIPLHVLDILFARLKNQFEVVYVRHEAVAERSFSADHNMPRPFADAEVLACHPEVHRFENLFARFRRRGGVDDVNTFKNALFSGCYRFISSQGGGAHHMSMFSGSLLVILHQEGLETRWAYGDGYYGCLGPQAPARAICTSPGELVDAAALFRCSKVLNGRLELSSASRSRLESFSPWRFQPISGSASSVIFVR